MAPFVRENTLKTSTLIRRRKPAENEQSWQGGKKGVDFANLQKLGELEKRHSRDAGGLVDDSNLTRAPENFKPFWSFDKPERT